ncbi:hypothetical protein GQR58_006705 [Nymphon striatum]|nr:hypothetical protein GQR58_006705 [Nymphon striatum]
MKKLQSYLSNISLIALLSFLPVSSVFAAGGTITFAIPGPASIPTLSGTMLVILSLLLFVVALKVANQKHAKAGKFFIAVLGMTAIMSGTSGIKMISEVNAGGASITIPEGTSMYTQRLDPNIPYEFNNRDYEIISVTVVPDADSTCGLFGGANGPSCTDVGTLAENEFCRVECRATGNGDGDGNMNGNISM